MGLKSGTIIAFQHKKIKKLLSISGADKSNELTICDVKNTVRAAFTLNNCWFYNKKIGFSIPDELLVPYLEQRHDLTNFVIEIVEEGDVPLTETQQPISKRQPASTSSESKRLLENSDTYIPVSKKFKQITNSIDVHLDDILKTSEGQALLFNFNVSNRLTDEDRLYLVKLITEYEMEEILMLENPLAIDYKRYVDLATAIVRRFPGEVFSFYYVPPSKVLKRIQSGKLYEHFTAMKAEFLEMESRENVENDFPEMWDLLNIIDDWPSYFKAWKQSFVLRNSYAHNIDEPLAYFKRFIAAAGEHAIDLVEHDFEKLYPGKANMLIDTWDQLSEKIFTEALVRCRKDVPLIMDLYGNMPQLSGFMMLGYFLKNFESDVEPFAKDNPGNLIAHFDTVEGNAVDTFKKYCLKNNRRDAMVFVTGASTEDLKYYVLVGDSLYCMETALKAVDFCFKCYQVLGFLYATKQTDVWHVLQNGVYGIERYDGHFNCEDFLNIFQSS